MRLFPTNKVSAWSFRSSGNADTLSAGCVFVGVWARLLRLTLYSCMWAFGIRHDTDQWY